MPLETLVDFIDWSPFFHTWELRGRYPAIFDDEYVGTEARALFEDAQKLLAQIIAEKRFTARGVYAFWPANAVGDDVELYTDETRRETLAFCVNELFPGAGDTGQASFWTGMRPMTPDGTPVLGRSRLPNLFVNSGHGTLGWTMACGCGRVIADLISGETPEIDMADLGPERYVG